VPAATPSAVILLALVATLAAGGGAFLGVERIGSARRRDGRAEPAERALAWANAFAAGLMLGIAYAVLTAGSALAPIGGTIAAAVGVALVHVAGRRTRAPSEIGGGGHRGARRAVAASALHSAAEGIAIGAAAALDVEFGLFLVLTFAVHNVSEGAVLGSALASGGRGAWPAAGAATLARTGQPIAAALALAVVRAAPRLLPEALGLAAGALVYLVLAELLPSSYRRTGRTSIAVVVSVAAGIVALLGGGTR
jgi:zinc transporter, ZIP family